MQEKWGQSGVWLILRDLYKILHVSAQPRRERYVPSSWTGFCPAAGGVACPCPRERYVPSSWTSFWPAAGGVACPCPRPVAPAPAPRTALRWGPWANYSTSALGECFVHCDACMFRLQFLTTILLQTYVYACVCVVQIWNVSLKHP